MFHRFTVQNHELPEGGLRAALEQIVMLKEQIRKNPEFLEIRSVEDLDRCLEDHLIGIILYMEGLDCIGSDVRLLTASVGIGGMRGLPYLEQEKSAGVRLLQGK